MKKKQSLKKKQRRRQRGGGFMDIIAKLNVMEGRTNTCMAAHPTQPLVAVGDDAGTVTLWEINPARPKKLAQLTGLQISVKCVEFHRKLPVVAAACSDKVLMWRFDQINREQEQQQEGGAVQQLEPSHTVCVFGMRSQEVVEQELSDAETDLSKILEQIDELVRRQMLKEEVDLSVYGDKISKQEKIRRLQSELDLIHTNARNEVSCIAFHPTSDDDHTSYISVGVNHNVPQRNRIHMYEFTIEPSSSYMLHSLPIYCKSEIRDGKYPENEKVLLTSFSNNGALFAFVTKSLDDGTTVLKVMIFKGRESRYEPAEYGIGYIRKKCDITCISPYRTDGPYSHDGSFYKFPGRMYNHYFIIGCDDGSLMAIKAVTIYVRRIDITRVEDVGPGAVWNAGEAIECIAVHPSLPLFASGSRNAVQVWDAILGEKTPRVVQFQVTPIISVGFNNNFLTACGRGVRVYSCNSNDYRGFKEELNKELQSGTEIAKYSTELVLAGRQGEPCSICGDPMNDPLTQPSLRSGPSEAEKEAEEVYLGCSHKFHKGCIERWLNQGKPCPLCRSRVSLEKTTPPRVSQRRRELQDLQRQQGARVVAESLVYRLGRYEPRGLDFGQGAAAASSAPEAAAVVEPLAPEPPTSAELTPEQLRAARLAYFSKQQQPPDSNGGGIKNKYSRKKYGSKKLKFRRRHSKKYNKN